MNKKKKKLKFNILVENPEVKITLTKDLKILGTITKEITLKEIISKIDPDLKIEKIEVIKEAGPYKRIMNLEKFSRY